jgi:hypothetical protein
MGGAAAPGATGTSSQGANGRSGGLHSSGGSIGANSYGTALSGGPAIYRSRTQSRVGANKSSILAMIICKQCDQNEAANSVHP